MRKADLLERIFSDAQVIDVDLSSWDHRLTLYVLADHVERVEGDRLAIFAIDFVRPSTIEMRFNHLQSGQLATQLGPDEHVQWRIDCSRIEQQRNGGLSISLWCAASLMPKVDIFCQTVDVRPVAHRSFDAVNPDWDHPSRGLARPSIEELAFAIASGRRPGRR